MNLTRHTSPKAKRLLKALGKYSITDNELRFIDYEYSFRHEHWDDPNMYSLSTKRWFAFVPRYKKIMDVYAPITNSFVVRSKNYKELLEDGTYRTFGRTMSRTFDMNIVSDIRDVVNTLPPFEPTKDDLLKDALNWTHSSIVEEALDTFEDHFNDNDSVLLDYIKKNLVLHNGKMGVWMQYKVANKGGRRYAMGPLQNLRNDKLAYLTSDGSLKKVDLNNAHIAIILKMMSDRAESFPALDNYLNNSSSIRTELATSLGVDEKKVKHLVIKILYGMSLTNVSLTLGSVPKFFLDIYKETKLARQMSKSVWKKFIETDDYRPRYKKEITAFAIMLQDEERKIMDDLRVYIEDNGGVVELMKFDEHVCRTELPIETINEFLSAYGVTASMELV